LARRRRDIGELERRALDHGEADGLLGIGHGVGDLGALFGPEHAGVDAVEPAALHGRDHRREIHAQQIERHAQALGDLAHQLDVQSLQLTLLVDELLRRQRRIDRHQQLAGRHEIAVGDDRLAGLRRGRRCAKAKHKQRG